MGQEAQVSGGGARPVGATASTGNGPLGKVPGCERTHVGNRTWWVRIKVRGRVRCRSPPIPVGGLCRWVVGCRVVRKQAAGLFPAAGGAEYGPPYIPRVVRFCHQKRHHMNRTKCGVSIGFGGSGVGKSGKIAVSSGITFGDICAPVHMYVTTRCAGGTETRRTEGSDYWLSCKGLGCGEVPRGAGILGERAGVGREEAQEGTARARPATQEVLSTDSHRFTQIPCMLLNL